VEVVAVADVDKKALGAAADEFGVERRHSRAEALIQEPGIDAVAVCVPAARHAEVGRAVLEAGKHLFVEKPLALRLSDCDGLIDGAGRSSAVAMVGFNWRWHPLVRAALRIGREGGLGSLVAIRTALTDAKSAGANVADWRNRRERGGGALQEKAPHHFDLWRLLLGSEVKEVSAMTRSEEGWDDETATVTARMASGAIASSVFAECTSQTNDLTLYGRKGHTVLAPYEFDGLKVVSSSSQPGTPRYQLRRLAGTLGALHRYPRSMPRRGQHLASYRGEWQHFVDSIRAGKQPACSLLDGRRALEISLAALESASRGQPVRVAG
jgi:predicted dehydrogenase